MYVLASTRSSLVPIPHRASRGLNIARKPVYILSPGRTPVRACVANISQTRPSQRLAPNALDRLQRSPVSCSPRLAGYQEGLHLTPTFFFPPLIFVIFLFYYFLNSSCEQFFFRNCCCFPIR